MNDSEKLNPLRQYTNKVNKYKPHTGLKQINKGRKKMGLPPLEPEGSTIQFNLPDGEVVVNR
jgi:hypothetical protein